MRQVGSEIESIRPPYHHQKPPPNPKSLASTTPGVPRRRRAKSLPGTLMRPCASGSSTGGRVIFRAVSHPSPMLMPLLVYLGCMWMGVRRVGRSFKDRAHGQTGERQSKGQAPAGVDEVAGVAIVLVGAAHGLAPVLGGRQVQHQRRLCATPYISRQLVGDR